MKLIDFNLDKALAGHPIVYRNGETPKEWHSFENYIVAADKNNIVRLNHKNGQIVGGLLEYDLFLANKEETLWVAVAKRKTKGASYGVFNAKESIEQFKEENLYIPEDYTYHQITREVE